MKVQIGWLSIQLRWNIDAAVRSVGSRTIFQYQLIEGGSEIIPLPHDSMHMTLCTCIAP